MEMEKDRKVMVLVISNIEKNVELFRVHIHEQSIRFDANFNQGIEKNLHLSEDIKEINVLWKEQKIDREQIFPIMLHLMNKYGDYLVDYYFKDYELDIDGHYIEGGISPEKSVIHYQHMKKKKELKRISRKEFEKNMNTQEIVNHYVDNYVKKGARFYSSERVAADGQKTMWYFMVVNEKFQISFFK